MDTEALDKEIARKSALVYLAITAAAALAFLVASSLIGNYTTVAGIGGAVWVSLLTLIVSMPLVTSSFKKKLKAIK
jgi:hypothetical protein